MVGIISLSSQILKLDVSNGAVKQWSKSDCSPSEPVFVPHPEAQNEDDGQFIVLLLYLLILSECIYSLAYCKIIIYLAITLH